jgi:hypothetical protein
MYACQLPGQLLRSGLPQWRMVFHVKPLEAMAATTQMKPLPFQSACVQVECRIQTEDMQSGV